MQYGVLLKASSNAKSFVFIFYIGANVVT